MITRNMHLDATPFYASKTNYKKAEPLRSLVMNEYTLSVGSDCVWKLCQRANDVEQKVRLGAKDI